MPSIDLTDATMHYELSGTGAPLLMIPGLGQTGRSFDPIVPLLETQFSLIRIDNRGIGKSTARRPARGLSDYACDCLELLEALQIDRAHLLGISFGGVLALNFAANHPSRVDRLVLVSTTDRFQPYLREVAKLLGTALRRFPMRLFVQMMQLMSMAPPYFDAHQGQSMPPAAEPTGRDARRALAAQLRCLASTERAIADDWIGASALMVSGEFDALIPNCYAKQTAARIPGSRYVMLPNCGHNPIVEQPDVLAEIVAEFLSEDIDAAAGPEFVPSVAV